MRVLLVDNLLTEKRSDGLHVDLQPHLGLLSLLAVLEKGGHRGLLFDPKLAIHRGELSLDSTLYRSIATRLLDLEPDVVGFTSLGCNFLCTAKTAGYVRAWRPRLPILLGGPHATVLDRRILECFPQFDVVARGEAERTILPLLEGLRGGDLSSVRGITFRAFGEIRANPGDGEVTDLDSLPIADYEHHPIAELGLDNLAVEAGRGCPFRCTFCSTAEFFGRKYRLKSAARIVAELDRLSARYGIRKFHLNHDLFTVNRRKVEEFCDAVGERGYSWTCSARMDCIDARLLERMRDAGCASIYFGVETGSPRMQERSKKRLDLDLFEPTLATVSRLGIRATVSFITGFPDEDAEDQAATLDRIGSTFAMPGVENAQLHLLSPEPGTEMLARHGERLAFDGYVSDTNLPGFEDGDRSTVASHPDVLVTHHHFEGVLPRRRHVLAVEIHSVLYGLGRPLLRYTLRRFRGRYSLLVDAMVRFAGDGDVEIDERFVERFFRARFGRTHHLAGLFRYMAAAIALRRRVARPRARKRRHAAAVLRRVPDCPAILAHLASEAEPPEERLLRVRKNLRLRIYADKQNEVRSLEFR